MISKIISLIFLAFLGESPHTFAANFVWFAQIACFMLFVSAAALFLKNILIEYQKDKKKVIIGLVLFGALVGCGFIYYFRSFWFSYY